MHVQIFSSRPSRSCSRSRLTMQWSRRTLSPFHRPCAPACCLLRFPRAPPRVCLCVCAHGVALCRSFSRSAIEAFGVLVLKLSESEFKPVFMQIYEWGNGIAAAAAASASSSADGGGGGLQFTDPHGLWRRSVLFYRVVNQLAEQLKAIFVPFYRHILDGLVKHLGAAVAESAGEKNPRRKRRKGGGTEKQQQQQHSEAATAAARVLADHATDAVAKLFLYDSDQEVATEGRILELVEPLASQLESSFGLDDAGYRARVAETIVPCVSQLAVCGSTYDIWKPLNHALLSRSRSDRAVVRTAALMCVEALFGKLAEEYLVLLPETIPFLAELMEDDDIEVEALVKKLVKHIEDLSGEKLTNYL
jgi:U3 small nucleolar RNA-associated protein 10